MGFCYNQLRSGPWKFFAELLKGEETAQQVQNRLGIQLPTMLRWQRDPKFCRTWEEVDALLRRRADTDVLIGRIAAARREVMGNAAVEGTAPVAAPSAVQAPVDGIAGAPAALGPSPVTDERERIRIEHGERAAQAYELMEQRRAQREMTQIADAASVLPLERRGHDVHGDDGGGGERPDSPTGPGPLCGAAAAPVTDGLESPDAGVDGGVP